MQAIIGGRMVFCLWFIVFRERLEEEILIITK
jgi:hypothetical protein